MDGLDRITEKILTDARAEAEAKLREAGENAEAVLADYAGRAAAAEEALKAEAETKAAAAAALAEGSARLDAGKLVLAGKRRLIDEAFALAEKKIAALPRADRLALLTAYARKAAPDGAGELILSKADRADFGSELSAASGIKLSEETRETGGGFVHRNGNVETDCAIPAIIAASRNELTDAVAKVLFK